MSDVAPGGRRDYVIRREGRKEGKGSCREECKTRRKIALLSCIEKSTLSFDKARVGSLPPTGEVLAKPKLIGT